MTNRYEPHGTSGSLEHDVKADPMTKKGSLNTEEFGTFEDVVADLKIAEHLVERAGYRSAGMNGTGNVVELMLMAAQIGRIADAMAQRGSEIRSKRSKDEG